VVVLVKVLDTASVERAGAADNAVHGVALADEELFEIHRKKVSTKKKQARTGEEKKKAGKQNKQKFTGQVRAVLASNAGDKCDLCFLVVGECKNGQECRTIAENSMVDIFFFLVPSASLYFSGTRRRCCFSRWLLPCGSCQS